MQWHEGPHSMEPLTHSSTQRPPTWATTILLTLGIWTLWYLNQQNHASVSFLHLPYHISHTLPKDHRRGTGQNLFPFKLYSPGCVYHILCVHLLKATVHSAAMVTGTDCISRLCFSFSWADSQRSNCWVISCGIWVGNTKLFSTGAPRFCLSTLVHRVWPAPCPHHVQGIFKNNTDKVWGYLSMFFVCIFPKDYRCWHAFAQNRLSAYLSWENVSSRPLCIFGQGLLLPL